MDYLPPDEVRVPLVAHVNDLALVRPIEALSATRWLHHVTHDARSLAIAQARCQGCSWREIAEALNADPGTVHRRFHYLDRRQC